MLEIFLRKNAAKSSDASYALKTARPEAGQTRCITGSPAQRIEGGPVLSNILKTARVKALEYTELTDVLFIHLRYRSSLLKSL